MNITFLPASQDAYDFVDPPKPSKLFIPEWYRSIKPLKETELQFNQSTQISNFNVKHCFPYLDALSTGYIQELWTDILIEPQGNDINFKCASSPPPISTRDKVSVKIDEDMYPVEFIWQKQWGVKLPKGYSMLITHPLTRVDLPFQTLSGVVDADSFTHHGVGNIPFFIKKGFVGIIPAGTPMYQIIPFKRDNWTSDVSKYDELTKQKLDRKIRRHFLNSYKNQYWHKKLYN